MTAEQGKKLDIRYKENHGQSRVSLEGRPGTLAAGAHFRFNGAKILLRKETPHSWDYQLFLQAEM